ncbi:hypothetical protein PRUPE_8G045400 [Prunus persica]|uniref:Glutamate--tRNA ligase n=1 Tax=Prunus persica TaxID=3760 RepID=M5VIM6_PRUPE|nr:hypothetical protein PRUPE_8G045400 [Prunus persica]
MHLFIFRFRLKLYGNFALLRYIGPIANLYGENAIQAAQIDEWHECAPVLSQGSAFENACKYLEDYLGSRSFFVDYSFSIADVLIWSSLLETRQRWESLKKSKKYRNLSRWFNSLLAEYGGALNEVIATFVGKRGLGKPATTKSKGTQANQESMKPSGFLHIGHSKAALLNQYFAQRYQGQLIVRFDDANPAKESNEFVDNLLKDIETLGIKYETVTYTSDYFPQLIEMAENLIFQGKAYVDDTPHEEMQKERMDGIESKCKNNNVEENLKLWKEMIAGSDRGLQCCVRGKLDMQDPNKSLRDPVYYRCNPMPHHRIGSNEYHDRNPQYHRVQEDMGLRKVHIYEFSRLNMVYTVLSKRKLLWFIQNKKVNGWDDPRFPTVQGIVRRGLKVEALIQFILEQGASKNLNIMEWGKLWTINKKIIDPVCPRHTAVIEEGRVLLTLTNGPEKSFVRIIPRHKKYERAGAKASIKVDEEVTLMDWGNAIVKGIEKDEDGNLKLIGVLNLEGSFKTTKLKLTWLPQIDELPKLSLMEFNYLITKKKLEGEDFLDVLNAYTEKQTAALGDILQLERKGYFRCDVPYIRSSKPIVLFAIPDGRQHTGFNR